MFGPLGAKSKLITADRALPGRAQRIAVPDRHAVLGNPLVGPFPDGTEQVMLALGCFWGAEKTFWSLPGMFTTAVGYTGGFTPNPTYEEVCSGSTGHAETVLVVFDPRRTAFTNILAAFWEGHDPTQGMRQGSDIGTQYRSAIYYTTEQQQQLAISSRDAYAAALAKSGYGQITTAIEPGREFYYAEDYHQQYLAKNPLGYCGHGGTGVSCPVGLTVS